jgi:hypothetical protein
VRGWLDTEAAAIVSAALDLLCGPGRSAPTIRVVVDEVRPSSGSSGVTTTSSGVTTTRVTGGAGQL